MVLNFVIAESWVLVGRALLCSKHQREASRGSCGELLGRLCSDKAHFSTVPDQQKHLDVFASAFGFFFLGFDLISHYTSPESIPIHFFDITDPLLWFFKVG